MYFAATESEMAKFPVLGSLLSSCRSFPLLAFRKLLESSRQSINLVSASWNLGFFLRVSRNRNYGYKVLSTSCLDLVILKYLVHQLFSVLLFTTSRMSGANCINNYIVVVRILTAFIHFSHNTQDRQIRWEASDLSSRVDILWRTEKIKNTEKEKEVCGKHNNIKPDISLKQAVHDPKDMITPKDIVTLEPLVNLITKSN